MSNARTLASYASNFPSFRNRIINGDLSNPINQRGAGSITALTGYTYDRWYYDGSTYLYQGIEDKNVNNGTYVISWEGAGINAAWKVSTDTTANNGPDATTGFTSVSNGGTFTVNEGTEYSKHLWIRFDGTLVNLDKVQVEEGTVATPFEHRPYGTELALCQRYCWRPITSGDQDLSIGWYFTNSHMSSLLSFPTTMRTSPTMTAESGYNFYRNGDFDSFNNLSLEQANTNNALLLNTTEMSGTAGQAGLLRSAGSTSVIFSAEL